MIYIIDIFYEKKTSVEFSKYAFNLWKTKQNNKGEGCNITVEKI